MLYYKIKKNKDFQKLFTKGKRAFSPALTLVYAPSDKVRMGVCVGKKHGKAVLRNRIKRLVRAAFSSKVCELSKPYSFVILPKVKDEYSLSDFEKSLDICFKREQLCHKK